MDFIDKKKKARLGAKENAVKVQDANLHAQFHLYSAIGVRAWGTLGWERGKITVRPRIIYDLSGLPLFYDFPLRRGRGQVGVIRTAANKALGDSLISTQVTPVGWDMRIARNELRKLLKKKYVGYRARRIRLVCYSYPKLALHTTVISPRRETKTVMMDVGDFTEIKPISDPIDKYLGQVPYSVLNMVSDKQEKEGPVAWNKVNREVIDLFKKEIQLEPKQLYKLHPKKRLEVIDKVLIKSKLIKLYTKRILDFCCHSGTCHDHECFCLHPQENCVHCARAAGQMMLCYWRYCYSQHEIAQAYGVTDTQLTPVSAVVPGLESLTNNCFDATLDWTASWTTCENEIKERRPFMSCVPGHARACAGTMKWNIWIIGQPQPRYLYIFDPWPPNTGTVSWENFNTTNYLCLYTLVRRTTNHV